MFSTLSSTQKHFCLKVMKRERDRNSAKNDTQKVDQTKVLDSLIANYHSMQAFFFVFVFSPWNMDFLGLLTF